ncbi:MAG TPA: hypothetical protein VMA54_14625 [Steroidobacteraceae bacterium]|nr:hypothetical protein [Steroidobacteraceae bacterium]
MSEMALQAVFAPDTIPGRELRRCAAEARCVVICGVPGVGKSLFVREQTLIARGRGRVVHRLEWDVSRLAFDQQEILARYPEIDNVTHPVIRRAAGLWVRQAVAGWFRSHQGSPDLLVIEAPLIGGRFSELARVEQDIAEPFLAGGTTQFLIPLPSPQVRAAIHGARSRESTEHRHALDRKNAPPPLVDAIWQQMLDTADSLGVARDRGDRSYSPDLYFAVYGRLLRHRHVAAVPVREVIELDHSPHALHGLTQELSPTAQEAMSLIALIEETGVADAIRATESWHTA